MQPTHRGCNLTSAPCAQSWASRERRASSEGATGSQRPAATLSAHKCQHRRTLGRGAFSSVKVGARRGWRSALRTPPEQYTTGQPVWGCLLRRPLGNVQHGLGPSLPWDGLEGRSWLFVRAAPVWFGLTVWSASLHRVRGSPSIGVARHGFCTCTAAGGHRSRRYRSGAARWQLGGRWHMAECQVLYMLDAGRHAAVMGGCGAQVHQHLGSGAVVAGLCSLGCGVNLFTHRLVMVICVFPRLLARAWDGPSWCRSPCRHQDAGRSG